MATGSMVKHDLDDLPIVAKRGEATNLDDGSPILS